MMRFAAAAAEHMPDAAIIEEHHATKVDRPSGTARHTADLIEAAGAPRPEIHSVRLPGLVAHQEVVLGALGQTLTIRHDTTSREAFVPGALLAIRRVHDLPPVARSGSKPSCSALRRSPLVRLCHEGLTEKRDFRGQTPERFLRRGRADRATRHGSCATRHGLRVFWHEANV